MRRAMRWMAVWLMVLSPLCVVRAQEPATATTAEPSPPNPALPPDLTPRESPDAASTTAPAAGAPEAQIPPEKQFYNPALAERLNSTAGVLLRSQAPSTALWKYAAGLIEAATRLAPDEPRYWRNLIEALGHTGEREA